MINKTTRLLNELLNHLLVNKAPSCKILQQGLTRNEIDLYTDHLNIQLPEEVYALYEWRNGINWTDQFSLGEMWLFRGGLFVSIERSVETYEYYLRNSDGWWNESIFQLFESGGGQMFFIDCDSNSPAYKMILFVDYGAADRDIVVTCYDSLDNMLETIIECYAQKAFWFEDSDVSINNHHPRMLRFDFEKELMISGEKNPRSDLWKFFAE